MGLTAGTRIGPYEIVAALGAGGMGVVYRARDTKLNRDVALKVLPDAFVLDPDRLARFKREAQVLASLNHPNIAAIHGFEDSDGVQALVLELVEGPTLADRIAEGPLPLDETLPIAKQIAEAVEAAHELGVIHRDLKPGNIKLRSDGTVKVLDFGLAKALDAGTGEAGRAGGAGGLTVSPTITTPAMTAMGVILGTAAYMSPEQAKGRAADKRSDVWAFGCVLYEMLTGKRAFEGQDVSDTLAAVLRGEPDWTKLSPDTPAAIYRLLRRCLHKDPHKRLPHIGVARLEIDEEPAEQAPQRSSPARRAHRLWLLLIEAALLLFVAVALGVLLYRSPRVEAPAVARLAITITDPNRFDPTDGGAIAISPDGSRIVYVGRSGNTTRLFQRRLDEYAATPIGGTEGAGTPFFSPDGRWIAFHSGDGLRKVPTVGGGVVTICRTMGPMRGGAWAPDDTIYFGMANGGTLWRVLASGGTPQAATRLLPGETLHRWPQIMPDGKTLLFTALTGIGFESATTFVQRLDTGGRQPVFQGGTAARYVNSGHLIYARREGLFAVPLDLTTLRTGSTPIPVVDNVQATLASLTTGGAEYAVSPTGTLVYAPGSAQTGDTSLVWVDRKGAEYPARTAHGQYVAVALSPDGSKAALTIAGSATSDIWIYDFARERMNRLTFDDNNDTPVWTPDGKRITYRKLSRAAGGASTGQIHWKAADNSSPDEPLTMEDGHLPSSWSGDGRFLVMNIGGSKLALLDMKSRHETPVSQAISAFAARVSWDGRWLGYSSPQTGEVYVQPFPSLAGRWQISSDGGFNPHWRRDGRELFYGSQSGQSIMAVSVTTDGASFNASEPMMLFTGPYLRTSWDVSADGQRFLMIKPSGQAVPITQLNVVMNWFEELKARVPTK